MRICSLLPSATEILYALGLGESVVGVSHECDYPAEALRKPHVIRTVIDHEQASSEAIDQAVRTALAQHTSLYELDDDLLHQLQPELVITQELCDVCAIDSSHVARAVSRLPSQPRIVSLHPHTVEDMLEDILRVGEATDRRGQAEQVVASCRARLHDVRARVAGVMRHPRVFCLEWLKPPMASGHWVPEMVELAGGVEGLGRAGAPSRYVSGEEIVAAKPEVLILMPCGFSIERTQQELDQVTCESWWAELPAVRSGRGHLVNGPAYFNRSGPRLIDGVELLAGLLHPQQCGQFVPPSGIATPSL